MFICNYLKIIQVGYFIKNILIQIQQYYIIIQYKQYKHLKKGDYKCYKFTTTIDVPLSNIISSFDDPKYFTEWITWAEGYYTIQRIKGPSILSYNEGRCNKRLIFS